MPSLPAKGLSLTEKVISTVGSLILTNGRGCTRAGSHKVLPIEISVRPENATMSPALASSTGVRPLACKAVKRRNAPALGQVFIVPVAHSQHPGPLSACRFLRGQCQCGPQIRCNQWKSTAWPAVAPGVALRRGHIIQNGAEQGHQVCARHIGRNSWPSRHGQSRTPSGCPAAHPWRPRSIKQNQNLVNYFLSRAHRAGPSCSRQSQP